MIFFNGGNGGDTPAKDKKQDIEIASLQTAINEINAAIESLQISINAINADIADRYDTQTQTLLNELTAQMSSLAADLAQSVVTDGLTANVANIGNLAVNVAATIEALTAKTIKVIAKIEAEDGDIKTLSSDTANIGAADITSLTNENANIGEANIQKLIAELASFETLLMETVGAAHVEADDINARVINADNVSGNTWHTPISTPDNTELLKITLPKYDGIIQLMTENGEFNISVINNFLVSYNQNAEYIYRLEREETVNIYLKNVGDTVNYRVLLVGKEDSIAVTSEIVDRTNYHQNIVDFAGVLSVKEMVLGVNIVFVDYLPEVGEEGNIYLSYDEGAYLWNEEQGRFFCFAGTVYQRKILSESLLIDDTTATTVEGALSTLNEKKQNQTLSQAITVDDVTATTVEEALNTLNLKKQNKTLDTSLTIGTETETTVEGALGALVDYADDLEDTKQDKLLSAPITVDDTTATTVETALNALNDEKQNETLSTPITANGETASTVEDALDALNAENKIVEGDLTVKGDSYFQNESIFEEDVNIKGNLVVEGEVFATEEQTVNTTGDFLTLRHGNPSGLGANEKSGVIVHNYANGKSAFIGADKDGIFRVSDNASETTHTYTNVSCFNNVYRSGLTQTLVTVKKGANVNQSVDEFSNCVYDATTAKYYHKSTAWHEMGLESNVLTVGALVEDSTIIARLETLTKSTLFYYRTLSILVIDDTQNEPILTRDEAANLPDKTLLMWDASRNRAVKIDNQPANDGQVLEASVIAEVPHIDDIWQIGTDPNYVVGYRGNDSRTFTPSAFADYCNNNYDSSVTEGSGSIVCKNYLNDALIDAVKFYYSATENFSYCEDSESAIYRYRTGDVIYKKDSAGRYTGVIEKRYYANATLPADAVEVLPVVKTYYREGNPREVNYQWVYPSTMGLGLPLGAIQAFAGGCNSSAWLLLDGRDTTGTSEELQTYYPALYAYLGNTNVLPDYRECALVGAGENTTDTIAIHDVYAVGEFKNDQLANHTHPLPQASTGSYNGGYYTITQSCGNPNTPTSVNRGKRKGVNYYIKATE